MTITIRDKREANWLWASRDIIRKDGKAIGPYGIAVYMALCCHANDEGRAWPSMETLANEIGCGERKVRECLSILALRGWISSEPSYRNDGSQTSNIYWLLPSPHAGGGAPQVPPPLAPRADERESVNENQEEAAATTPRLPIFALYEDNIGLLTPFVADELKEIDAETPAGWFADAVKEAVLSNARNLKYVKAILTRWKVEGRGGNPKNGNGHKPYERPVLGGMPASKRREVGPRV